MAENKTINIKINSNTKEATQDTQKYNKAIGSTKKQYDAVLKSGDSYEKQLSDINKIVKETPLNVRDMNKQIQAYQSIALSAGRETPVGKEALKKASELRDRYIDIQNETKRLADDQKNLQGVIQLVGTGVAGFGAVQSAMALTGVESEKLRETMVKLQAAQTLMTSINQIATATEKESSAMLLLKSARMRVLTASTAAYTFVTGAATTGMKLFRLALISTGIGAIVVLIGMLIANFSKVTGFIKKGINSFKKLGGVMKLLLLPITAAIAAFELVKKGLQALGVIESDEEKKAKARHKAKMERYLEESRALSKQSEDIRRASRARQKALDNEIEMLKAQGKKTRGLQRQKLEDNILLAKQEAEIAEKQAKLAEKNNTITASAFRTSYEARLRIIKEAERKLLVFDTATNTERTNNYKKYAKDRLSIARKIEDLENSLMEDGIEKDLEINRDKFRRLLEDTKKNEKLKAKEKEKLVKLYTEQQEQSEAKIREKYDQKEIDEQLKLQEEFDKIRRQNQDALRTDEENELLQVAEKYDVLQAQAQGNAEALNEIEIARLNEENEIKLQYANEAYEAQKAIDDKADADQKVRDDKAKADAEALQEYKINVVQGGLSAINDIAALFAKGNEKQQKRAFQVQKAVGIAQATINTAQAITKVFAETTDFTPTQSLRIANAVGIGIAGAAQIASIASQQFEGGGGDVESPTDTGAGGGEAVAPSFNVVGDSGINQIAQLQQTPVQAFVVSGEVTTSQALDRNRVQNATL
jgi:hypothetical protein